ncbi:hypothetical protein CSA57_10890 [candidate division KSB3 bacterium]|nr:MAG: hypothetical protein CSA57_10890 [candidate division KSB3 bacterium]
MVWERAGRLLSGGRQEYSTTLDTQQSPRFNVELLSIGPHKEKLERALQRVRGLCVSPPEILKNCPCLIASNISGNASQKLQLFLEQFGAHVAVREHHRRMQKASDRDVETSSPGPTPLLRTREKQKPSKSPALTLKRSVAELTHALKDKDWTVRQAALIELGATPSQGVIQHIIVLLKDDIWQVRRTALDILGQIGSNTVLKEMLKGIEDDVWQVRLQAVDSLGRLHSDKAVKSLLSALNDENWHIRVRTLHVLGEILVRRSVNNVMACLQDEVWQVRQAAAELLGKLQSDKAVSALTQALWDSNWQVRSAAISALRQIGDERSILALLDALEDEEWIVHWKAAHALGKIGTADMLPALLRLSRDVHPSLRELSSKALNALEFVTPAQKHSVLRAEFRAEDPYAGMRYIAPGECLLGDEHGPEDARPACRRQLNAYFIDTYEVTNAQYKVFQPSHDYPQDMADFPVVNVSWDEAKAYAVWIGKRLPTEAEWEKAARGAEGRRFPWGEKFDPAKCNTAESGNSRLTPVGCYPEGRSPFGVCDMVGNVLEWTADRYRAYPWSEYEQADFAGDFIVLRGASWIHSAERAACFTRFYAPAENRNNFIGFRCVKDISTEKKDDI